MEPFEGVPDGGGAPLSLGTGGVPPQAAGGAAGESNGTAGKSAGGADPGGVGGVTSGGAASGGTAGAPAGGASGNGGNGSCYVAGCPGCILSQSSLFGTPCCTAAGKCGCQAVFTTTCM